jgi:N-acetylmuramoyl-L-alanine amidase
MTVKKIYLLILCFFAIRNTSFCQNAGLMYKTIGALAYMEYGLGDDRLGGAKMTYLDSNVQIKVIDSIGTDYKIRLSANHVAYIPKTGVKPTPEVKAAPYYLSSSFKVYGDSAYDYVTVQLPQKLPYKSQQMINPAGIDVDIYGATSNTNWITQLQTAKEIDQTWYEQIEDDVLRIHIRLKHQQHWGYAIYYDSLYKKLMIRVKRPPAADFKKWKIAIDAGHGGSNSGAAGTISNKLEKEYTLLIAKQVQTAFKKAGIKKVIMTREIDTTLSMEERVVQLRKDQPNLLLSFHLNSSSVDTIKGTSTFYRYIGFRPLTQVVLKKMLELGLKEYGNVGNFNFALSGPTEFPNCLVEVAFLSNMQDENLIMQPLFHKKIALKMVEAIKLFAKESSKK